MKSKVKKKEKFVSITKICISRILEHVKYSGYKV